MPSRRRFATRRFRPRPRTRWLSIVPAATSHSTNNTYNKFQLVLQDANGSIPWQEFSGGTILKVILDQFCLPIVGGDTNADGNFILHCGIFATEDVDPAAGLWSPNTPFGNFMQRWTHYLTAHTNGDPTSGGSMSLTWGNPGVQATIETNVKRVIHENTSLWLSHYYFENVPISSVDVGWTGRVLIQLP